MIRAWCSCNGTVSQSHRVYGGKKKRRESLARRKVTNIMQGREEDAQRKTKEKGYPRQSQVWPWWGGSGVTTKTKKLLGTLFFLVFVNARQFLLLGSRSEIEKRRNTGKVGDKDE